MTSPVETCKHDQTAAAVTVNCLTATEGGPITSYSADVRIWCQQCDTPFEFIGAPMGFSPAEPRTSVNGQEMRLPIRPENAPEGFGLGGPGFGVRITA